MSRLMKMVLPHALFMGQKDYQQCMVIKRMLQLVQIETEFVTCPTIRETDGLAMSSRNLRLNNEDRQKAPIIYRCLQTIQQEIQKGSLNNLKQSAQQTLEAAGFKVDYVEIADAETLQSVSAWDGSLKLVTLIAAFLGEVRLIDNIIIMKN